MQTTPPHLSTDLVETLTTGKRLLTEQYGDRLKSLILFGSAVRQSLTPDSDLDLLVVLQPPFDYFQELRTVVDVLYPLQLESSHWISAKPASQTEFIAGTNQLYRNVQQEGIPL